LAGLLNAQSVVTVTTGSKNIITSRFLSVPNNNTAWVSGSQGTIGKSFDGGNTWKWMKVKGFEKTGFQRY
jgi:photosystem II stability/assembly factor-like uncharacterized protein